MSRKKNRMTFLPPKPTNFKALPTLAPFTTAELQDPEEMFLRLCSYTVPYGGEDIYYGVMLKNLGFERDRFGNYVLEIGDGLERSNTCFMAHLDTSSSDVSPIHRVINEGVCTARGTILGADDRAGVTVLLYLVSKDVPGLYYLFAGEERGCEGSSSLALSDGLPAHITKAISFDRKGKTNVITHQSSARTCSDDFANALCNALNEFGFQFAPDDTGLYTDSREFAGSVSECTNISVGYYNQHSLRESQDLAFLAYLCRVCADIDWQALPAVRTPCENDYEGQSWDGSEYFEGQWIRSEKEYAYGGSREDAAHQAIEGLADGFELGIPPDRNSLWALVQPKSEDTVDMIEMLIDELSRSKWRDSR